MSTKKQIQVETFEMEDAYHGEASQAVADVESIALCEKLGLEGQLSISNKETQTRSPFKVMTKDEYVVYSLVCPEHVEVTRFKTEPIPLRVLQVLAYAKSDECPIKFDTLEIWSVSSAVIKDPLLVGKVKTGAYEYSYYLLARWGEELEHFSELMKKAQEIRFKAIQTKLREGIALFTTELEKYKLMQSGDMDIQKSLPNAWL